MAVVSLLGKKWRSWLLSGATENVNRSPFNPEIVSLNQDDSTAERAKLAMLSVWVWNTLSPLSIIATLANHQHL